MTDTQENLSPATLGEVNLTLRFMQKNFADGIETVKTELKNLGVKVDSIPSGLVSTKEFTDFKAVSEKDRGEIREDVKVLKIENGKRKEFQDTLIGKMWGIGVIAGILVAILTTVVNHLWK